MKNYQKSPTQEKISVGESVRIIRELQKLSQNELSGLTGFLNQLLRA